MVKPRDEGRPLRHKTDNSSKFLGQLWESQTRLVREGNWVELLEEAGLGIIMNP